MIGADRWIYGHPFKAIIHMWERLTRGFSRFDMWDAEEYLADVISGAAYWHFAHTHSWPGDMPHDDWLDVLLEIRDGFDSRDECGYRRPTDLGFDLFRENFAWLWH